MQDIIQMAADLASDYLIHISDQSVYPSPSSIEILQSFSIPLQDQSLQPQKVLAELDRYGSPATVKSAGGRYFGFVIGGSLPAALGANILAGAWDQNAGLEVASPIGAHLEKVCQDWLVDLLGLPKSTAVAFVTGATMANFTGLAAARHALLAAQGWDVEANGLFAAPPITVIVGDEVHVSLLKALSLLGLGRDRVVRVPADGQGRFVADQMPIVEGPTLVCLQAGNVNTGAFDPINPVADQLEGKPAWLHVDAAFGLWAATSPEKRYLTQGLERANSIATDAHKWLNVPYDSGIVFVRGREHLNAAMAASAAYLQVGGTRDPHLFTPEMSRRARAVEIWAALRSLGRSGVADLIDRNCAQAQRFAEAFENAGYEVLNEVVLNQVMVSFGTPEVTRAVIEGVQQDGICWCGGTQWQGRTAMRISVSSWATTEDDVSQSLDAILRIAEEVA
jgi:glutamate/tyrosine decarboxylase-like PLP-dependent enzyme